MNHEADQVLQNEEINAILQFLETYVKAFNPRHIKRDILNVLIRKSTVLEIDGGNQAYSHITNSLVNRTPKGVSQSQLVNGKVAHPNGHARQESSRPLINEGDENIQVADHNAIQVKLAEMKNGNAHTDEN